MLLQEQPAGQAPHEPPQEHECLPFFLLIISTVTTAMNATAISEIITIEIIVPGSICFPQLFYVYFLGVWIGTDEQVYHDCDYSERENCGNGLPPIEHSNE